MNNYQKMKGMNFSNLVKALEGFGCPPVPCENPSDDNKEGCYKCWTHYLASPVVEEEEQENKNETQQKEQETPTETEGPERYVYTLGLDDDEIVVACNKGGVERPSWRTMPSELSDALQAFGVQQTLRGVFGKNMDFAAKSKKYATMVHEAHNYVVATRDAFFAKADMWAWLWFYKADSDDWKDALRAECLCAFKEARKWDDILQSETRFDEFIDGFCYGPNGESDIATKHTGEEK